MNAPAQAPRRSIEADRAEAERLIKLLRTYSRDAMTAAMCEDGRYVRCVFDGATHYAVPYRACEVMWIDPTPLPGALPTVFPPLNFERTAHHG